MRRAVEWFLGEEFIVVIEMDVVTSIRPVEQPSQRAVVQYELVRIDGETHMVLHGQRTAGFVSKAGDVYVALEGPTLALACEVGQSLMLDIAVDAVKRADRRR